MEDYGFYLLDKLGVLPDEHTEKRYAAQMCIDDPHFPELLERAKNNDPDLTLHFRGFVSAVGAEIKRIAPAVKRYQIADFHANLNALKNRAEERQAHFEDKCPDLMLGKKLRGERVEINDLWGNMPLMHTQFGPKASDELRNIKIINDFHRGEDACHRAVLLGGDALVKYMLEHEDEVTADF